MRSVRRRGAPGRPRLWSLANKVALLLCAVIGLAFAFVFLYVVPQLEASLERQRTRDLGGRPRRPCPC